MLYLEDTDFKLYQGHVLECLIGLPSASVDCVVTSPPYYGLRDYGVEPQEWGLSPDCDHSWTSFSRRGQTGGTGEKSPLQKNATRKAVMFTNRVFCRCSKCGGQLVPLGLEATAEEFVDHLIMVFSEIHRVLKSTGNCWVNLGDSHSNKDLIGVPWMFAFGMKDAGWILRQCNIWNKPNPMPESCTDRTTTAHEYLFHFTKIREGYWYDADAIREPHTTEVIEGWEPVRGVYGDGIKATKGPAGWNEKGRNKRSVWEIPVQPYKEAHFATYPTKLVEPCIKAGCPTGGVVLDPFMGSGTTAFVSRNLGRKSVGIELNEEYCRIIAGRTRQLSLVPEEEDTQGDSENLLEVRQGGSEKADDSFEMDQQILLP